MNISKMSYNSPNHRRSKSDKYYMFKLRPVDMPEKHLYYNRPSEKLPGSVLSKGGEHKKLDIYSLEDLVESPFKEELRVKYK